MVLLMTLLMGLSLSGIAVIRDHGLREGMVAAWMHRFATTYAVVLPVVLVVSPIARRLAIRLDRMLVDD